MKSYILPEEVRQGLINYLSARPYGEVVAGIDALNKLTLTPEVAKHIEI